jgi:SAM-dependent methyltransferase
MSNDSQSLQHMFVCPYSLGPLTFTTDKAISQTTNDEYPIVNGQVDFRLRRPKKVSIDFTVGTMINTEGVDMRPIGMNPKADVDFSVMNVPHHLSREVLSYFPKAKDENSYVLDLGCGSGLHRAVCEKAGYKYIGLDYNFKQATILGDAHALPLPDNSVDFVIAIAVMEHIQYPWIMAKEVLRVLKPGGRFIGTVSFLEPYHDMSYYHLTYLGVLTNFRIAGFEKIVSISPNKGWEGIEAVSIMHYFSTMNWRLIKALIYPYYLLHRLWWKFNQATKKVHYHPFDETYRLLASSGSFIFVVDK